MNRTLLTLALALSVAGIGHAAPAAKATARPAATARSTESARAAPAHAWSLDATAIESCTCPMLCRSVFGGAATAEGATCRFNAAYKVSRGHEQGVSLDGARFWVAGDLGADPARGAEWMVVTFDHALDEPQREALGRIVAKLYPHPFKSLATDAADVSWVLGGEEAHALLNNGKTAEIALRRPAFGQTGKTPILRDAAYRAATANTGLLLMPATLTTYRVGTTPFEAKGTSGYVTTFQIHGDDAPVGAQTRP